MNHELPNSPDMTTYHGTLPEIVRDPYFDSDTCPFEFTLDEEKLTKLLACQGVPEDKIESMKVVINAGQPTERDKVTLGTYDRQKNEITVFPNNFFSCYLTILGNTDQIIYQDMLPEQSSFKFIRTKRLGSYLVNSEIPTYRRSLFARKLIVGAMQRAAFSTVAHEAEHKIDHNVHPWSNRVKKNVEIAIRTTGPLLAPAVYLSLQSLIGSSTVATIATMVSSWMSCMIGFYITDRISYAISPIEKSARKFEKNITNGHFEDWNMIHFMPKKIEERLDPGKTL